MADERCWICLGSEGDLPPLASPSDSGGLISPCGCSLRVHRKCLLDWTASIALKASQDGDFVLERSYNPQFIVRDDKGSHTISLKPLNGVKVYTNSELRCPQCQTLYKITSKPASLLRFTNLVRYFGKRASMYMVWSSLGTVIIGSIGVSIYSFLSSLGFKMLQKLAPSSVIMKLLNINERNLDIALANSKVGFRHLSLAAGLPLFLLSMRSDSRIATLLRNIYPLTFFQNLLKYEQKDPRNFLVISEGVCRSYNFLFKLTFNRLHYRLLREINTCFLGNKFPLEEIEAIEEENREFAELEHLRVSHNKSLNLSWYEKVKLYFFPNYSTKERELISKKNKREWELTLVNDYSTMVQDKSRMLTLLTTSLWPVAGNIIGTFLLKSSHLRSLSASFTNTPDEQTYLLNLIGCCIAVLLKDVANLATTWRMCQQYKNIGILDSSFEGFTKVPKIEDPVNEIDNITEVAPNFMPGGWIPNGFEVDEDQNEDQENGLGPAIRDIDLPGMHDFNPEDFAEEEFADQNDDEFEFENGDGFNDAVRDEVRDGEMRNAALRVDIFDNDEFHRPAIQLDYGDILNRVLRAFNH